jgi:hypothetical protein
MEMEAVSRKKSIKNDKLLKKPKVRAFIYIQKYFL